MTVEEFAVTAPDPPLWLQNEQYPARVDRQLIYATLPEGIVRGLNVTPHTPAPDYTVTVSDGLACIYGDDEDDQGAYLATLADPVSVSIAPPAGMNRIDEVVFRVNDSQAGGAAGDNATIAVVQGTPTTGTAVAPALPKTAISLAHITLTPSTTAIATTQISGLSRAFARGVGNLETYAGSIVPSWGLLCDGRAVSRTVYRDLFSVIGTLWGTGDGSTTFNLPDFRGRVPVGYNAGDTLFNAVGKVGGSKNAVVITHHHDITHDHPAANTSMADATTGTTGNEPKVDIDTNTQGSHTHDYQRMKEDNIFAAGTARSGGATLEAGVNTSTAGGHSHHLVVPAHNHSVTVPKHDHTFNVPKLVGNSADTGVAGTNQNLQPFATVNVVVRT